MHSTLDTSNLFILINESGHNTLNFKTKHFSPQEPQPFQVQMNCEAKEMFNTCSNSMQKYFALL